jgi:hypothetical protein
LCRLVDDAAAGRVDQDGIRLREPRGIDQVPRRQGAEHAT